MLRTCILLINVFLNIFDPVNCSEFPSFFDDDDLKELGAKGHKSNYIPAPVTGRYMDRPPGYIIAEGEQYRQKIPPNGLPIHQLPRNLLNRPPITAALRGDPTNQNIVQQLDQQYANSPFPPPDGKSYGGDDTHQLMEMPKRLTQFNRWDEFRALIAEEGARQNGKMMPNWEDDAHRWAAYSRHLLERGKYEQKQKEAAARTKTGPKSPLVYSPSLGHEAYWAETGTSKSEMQPMPYVTAAPVPFRSDDYPNIKEIWNERGEQIGWRRQMNDPFMQSPNEYDDNIQGPLEREAPMPPIYYKNKDTPQESEPSRQVFDRMAEMDYPDAMRTGNLARYLPPYPEFHSRGGPEMVPAGEYSPNMLTDLGKTPGKIPGPGSESHFPNGYRPYGSQPQMSYGIGPDEGGGYSRKPEMSPRGSRGNPNNIGLVPRPRQYPEAQPAALREGAPGTDYTGPEDYVDSYNKFVRTGKIHSNAQGGPLSGLERDYGDGFHSSMAEGNMGIPSGQMGAGPLPGGKYPKNFGQPNERPHGKPSALREGGGYPSMDYPTPGMGSDNYWGVKSPLRMGGMSAPAPGPGSEGDFPEGFHPNMAGGNMGLPPPPKELGPLPGRVRGRPPHDMEESDLVKARERGMPGASSGGNSPRGMQGMGGPRGPSPPMSQAIGYHMNKEPGESLEDYIGPSAPGTPPGHGAEIQIRQRIQPPRSSRAPSGYELLTIAKKKIAASNRMEELTDDSALRSTGTTTPRPITKEEIIRGLPQFDDFHAPIRWVKFNSPDTRDGLARLTDRKTHQNQQYVIEGELYLPIIDESMSRLGWTTEDPLAFTTDPPIVMPPNDSAMKVVIRSMNLNKTDEREWLAYETILGSKTLHEKECEGQSCQARCYKTGCDAVCKGDTCATGCVGVSCNAVCRGPGCFSMCIGDQCTAKCEGLNCETRCWGKSCESACRSFSCQYTVNGIENRSNATWDQMYPQYDHRGNPDVYGKQNQKMPGPGRNGVNSQPLVGDGDDYYAD